MEQPPNSTLTNLPIDKISNSTTNSALINLPTDKISNSTTNSALTDKLDNLRVPPGSQVITNPELANFEGVLVIIKNENKNIIAAEWAPITFAKLEANRRTLKIVSGKDLNGIKISNRINFDYNLDNNILISDSFLTNDEVLALIDLLNENDNFYNNLYTQAVALLAASSEVDSKLCQQFIVKIGNRLDYTNKVYALALKEWKNDKWKNENRGKDDKSKNDKSKNDNDSDDEEVEINRNNKNKPGSQYPQLEEVDLSTLDTLSREAFDKAFKTIKYKIKPVLPKYSYTKIKGFLDLINLLIDIIPNKVESYRSFHCDVNDNNSLITLRHDFNIMNISELMAFAVSSVELCTIIPHLLDLPTKAIEKSNRCPSAFTYRYFTAGLAMLVNQEVRDVTSNYNDITWDSAYIIPYKVYQHYMENSLDYSTCYANRWIRPVSTLDQVFELVDYYSNGLISKLDLTDSYVTGSILPACIYIPQDMQAKFYIDTWYPPVYTVPNNYDKYRRIVADLTKLKVEDKGDYINITNGQEVERLTITEGADIDIAVNAETEEQFDQIVNNHINIIKQVYGQIGIEKIQRKSGFTYEITGGHRLIQIYRSSIGSILSHHLPVVRGCITGNGSDRQVYISATAFHSYRNGSNYNYYYFAGKYNPSEVLLKYRQRGFKTHLPMFLFNLLHKYETMTAKWDPSVVKSNFSGKVPIFGALTGYGNFYLNSLWAEDALNSYNNYKNNNRLTIVQLDLLKTILNPNAYQKLIDRAGTMPQKVKSRPVKRAAQVPVVGHLTAVGPAPIVNMPQFKPAGVPMVNIQQLKPAGIPMVLLPQLKPAGIPMVALPQLKPAGLVHFTLTPNNN